MSESATGVHDVVKRFDPTDLSIHHAAVGRDGARLWRTFSVHLEF